MLTNVCQRWRDHRASYHETTSGRELPCVGWLVHQLGPGNNLSLRIAAMTGHLDANVRTVGPQHERLEDTLPSRSRRRRRAR